MSTLTTTSLSSSNLIAALLETAYKLQIGESALSVNPNRITININDDTKIITVVATIPADFNIESDGSVAVVPVNYANVSISPNGDVKSSNGSSLLLEMCQEVVDAEDAATLADPTFIARVTLAMDANTSTFSMNTTIPYTVALVSGKPTLTAVDYLP